MSEGMTVALTVMRDLREIWQSNPELYAADGVCGFGIPVMVRRASKEGANGRDWITTCLTNPTVAPLVYLIGVWTAYVTFEFIAVLDLFRYVTWHLAFVTLAFFGWLHAAGGRTRIVNGTIVVYLIFCVININGIARPELTGKAARNGNTLERSREYVAELRSNVRTAAFLEKHAENRPIVISRPLNRALVVQELGYVFATAIRLLGDQQNYVRHDG
jgi:hypothetical protein